MPRPADVLESMLGSWLADPESDVVGVERVDGRWAVRLRQRVRDATTVWWDVGTRSIRAEAYVLPEPPSGALECFRLCLDRNRSTRRARFAVDREGAIVVRGWLPVEDVSPATLDELLGEVYELVETTFGPLVRLGFGREKTP